ncbi:uncharacterized protein Dwil_GK24554 [Drosophila willistoni]|uniref:Nose resistant-to-fluoxetine protein N-terminal domain-containing protein n=1 Tax=Drosophila willistoni TaxID=7260 RepID=B4N0C5_DROWI|nr:uncharacterized protein Dwil_GK24554 [Drosophila willistoni]
MVGKFVILVFCGLALIGGSKQDVTVNRKALEQLRELRPLGVEFSNYYRNITINDLTANTGRIDQQDLNCLADLSKFLQDLSGNKLWAIKMLDSWGSIPSGMISGNTIDLGNYDQCYKINLESEEDGNNLKGKYCLASLPFGKLIDSEESSFISSITIETAICFPASCSASNMDVVLRQLFNALLNINYSNEVELVNEETCKYKGANPLDGLSIFTINQGKLNIVKMYIHRYLRLTPLLLMGILFYWKLLPYMGDGPLYDNKHPDNFNNCAKTWWMNLLYIQNYATTDYCLGHAWYLAVDMQMFIISPILLISLYKWGKKAAAGIVVLILLLSACLFSSMMIGGYSMFIKNISVIPESHPVIYRATHTHAAPWLIGALFGYFVHETKDKKFQLSRITVWLGWLISLGLFSTCLFALLPASQWDAPNLSRLADASYFTLTRLAWPLGLCWLVFACMNGYGGMINGLLSHQSWQPLSKLSYSAFIWHKCVQVTNNRTMRGNTFFSDYNVLLSFWTTFGMTLLFAYEMHLLVEAPVLGLERIFWPKKSPAAPKLSTISPEATQSPSVETNPDTEVAAAPSAEITTEST